MGCEIKNSMLATMLALALAALVISGCSAKKEAAAPAATSAPSSTSMTPSQTKAAAIPPNERPFVAPPSVQGPQSGSQFVTRNGQLPPNGSEP